MNRRAILALSMTGLLCSEMALPGAAVAQTAKDLVGAWTFVSNVSIRPDGSKYDGFSKGTTIFDGSAKNPAILETRKNM